MSPETHSQLASFIWNICNLLRGPYRRNEYRKVILPLTVLRRFDALLAPTKQAVLKKYQQIRTKPDTVVRRMLEEVSGQRFYNLSQMQFVKEGRHSLLDDPNNLAPNLNSYINAFSPNVRAIMERFAFDQQIARMAEKNILFEVVKAFCDPKLDQIAEIDNTQMGYVFEELIRIGAEQANEEAGEHFTPREVIKLMVNLLLAPEEDLARSHVVKTIYDPACGTGGMLSVSENYIRQLNSEAHPKLFGQDWNDEAWAVCKSDMLIKGEDADNIVLADSFTKDGFNRDGDGNKWTFDYMLANPPFGVEWKQQQRYIQQEADTLGYAGRFGAGTPRINDGAFLFLQHMISKMRPPEAGGSRIGIVFNGSPLFTGDAGTQFKDSGIEWLGEVPETWEVSSVKYEANLVSKGTTPSTIGREMADEGIRFLKAENLKDLRVDLVPEFYIDAETDKILSRSRLHTKDVLIVIAGATTGKTAVVEDHLLPANTNQAVCFIRLKNKEYAAYFSAWISTKFIQDIVWNSAVQSAQPNLAMEDIRTFPCLVPPENELSVLIAYLDRETQKIDTLITKIETAVNRLQEYRTALVTAAVTGKIDVRDHADNKEAA